MTATPQIISQTNMLVTVSTPITGAGSQRRNMRGAYNASSAAAA
jgi:hypothetical protein